ncbi:MAG TPA: FAD-dependent oxidoreductase [Acidobacteriota bacterium]|nr:FAD-dependent oxidoreductase [Acidobacteriota bacterium]
MIRYILVALLLVPSVTAQSSQEPDRFDIVIYGGTSGGVIAAVQASRMGHAVVLIEPGKHLGGMTSGGLGATDIGNKAAIGGLSREFYRRVARHYAQDSAWKYQAREAYQSSRQRGREDTMWTFEPHVAERIFNDFVSEARVPVVFQERLKRPDGVIKEGRRIVEIITESGRRFAGKVFIDATYEGDLMAEAGLSYYVGREPNSLYRETLNGVQTLNARYHQFRFPVSPYRIAGKPESGLLPGINPGPPGPEGAGDYRVQAYNFRLCLTDVPENQIPFEKPDTYNPEHYELMLRHFEAGEENIPWINTPMPNRKTDINNREAVSSDFIGMNYDYPEADYGSRERIIQQHRDYQMGLFWCLANEPRVPEKIRSEVARWGLAKDEFTDNGGWPWQIYVREARRMVGAYIMTQDNCQGRVIAPDPVGLAAYTMDSHHVQRYIDENGAVRNEGDVQVGGFPPYPIAFGSITPRTEQCENLLVPVALSASHIAYGSIRMEPVFMVLGQSAATAAAHAIQQNVAVQDVDRNKLQQRLLNDGQILKWTPSN